jgi:hypothetical protein
MGVLSLHLDSAEHVYNPQFKTFHVTMDHLYGTGADNRGVDFMGNLPIRLTNPNTGVTVEFEWVTRNIYCNLYKALYAHDYNSPATQYRLIVWENAATMRSRYSAEIDLYRTFVLHAPDPAAIDA